MPRPWAVALALLLPFMCAAEEVQPAAERVAASLTRQMQGAGVQSLSVAPLKDPQGKLAKPFADALSRALAKSFQVRDWEALDKAQRERALNGNAPQLKGVQALVVGEITGGLAAVRAVATANGTALAAETAQLTGSAPAAASSGLPESQSVEVAMRKLADQLADGFSRMPGNARYRRVAVLPFTETGDEARKLELGAVLTAELSTSLRRDHAMLLVERQRLQQVMGEIKLGQSGAVEGAAEIGKLADAQALVLGSVASAGDRFLIDARVVATETAEALATASESVPAANLVAFSSDAVVLRSRKDALFRSLLIPGWGQIYNREPVKGYAFMGAVLVAGGAAIAFHEMGASAESQYRTASIAPGQTADQFAAEVQGLRNKAQDRYGARNIALIAVGGLWLLNVLDAYFSGVDGDRMLGQGLSARF